MEEDIVQGLLRTLCFHDAWGYAPTYVELTTSWDRGQAKISPSFQDVRRALDVLVAGGLVSAIRGRVIFLGREDLVYEHERRERLFPRKIRRARLVAAWLARILGVRFVALCNTTALAHARDQGDLDFFVVTKEGSLWQTRGWSALPFKFLGLRPRSGECEHDAVCLSFFVDDRALDLRVLQLPADDPYFRHWFLSLLPLIDDGIGIDLWNANQALVDRHPLSSPWRVHPELKIDIPALRFPFLSCLEPLARRWQYQALNPSIRDQANCSTHVVVNDQVLKLHVTDNRESYREAYYERCRKYGVAP